jgi:hypothetical protein
MLIALTVGAELFGVFGAIFAAPTAGLLQAFFTAIWIQYRDTHKEEFLDDEGGREQVESVAKTPEQIQIKATHPTLTVVEDNKEES